MGAIRLGVDIGGTFTDLVMLDEETGAVAVIKVPSQPSDPASALLAAASRALEQVGEPGSTVTILSHGTTIVTNAILEGTLARTALITTKGFRDVLEIGRHLRPDLYDLDQDKPVPIVPRERRCEVTERMAADGTVIVPFDRTSAAAAIDVVKGSNVAAVAVCFLHSYANALHETMLRDMLSAAVPNLAVSISSDVCREIREFERTSTVTLNAAAMPVVSSYLETLQARAAKLLPNAQVLLMRSNGGSMTVNAARQTPAHLIYSGPAAGVLACKYMGDMTGRKNALGFDMGGTSTDISLVYQGKPLMTTEADVGGYPVKLPVLDIHTVGAGGGSIAWIDPGGGLHVGPQSAGAEPGPVAYGRGGTEPTVTDANLVLGRISPDRFLGGELRLDTQAALRAIEAKIAKPLGLDPIVAAFGIVRLANSNMATALKVSSAERGYDPRDFALIAFGGGGPVHAAALAKDVGFPTVLVPAVPGVFSAFGLLIADIRHDFVRSYVASAVAASPETLSSIYREMETLGSEMLDRDGIAPAQRALQRTADLRYVGQAYEVNVTVPGGVITQDTIAEMITRFHAEHLRQFAHSAPEDVVEIVNLRLVANGVVGVPSLPDDPIKPGRAAMPIGHRSVYFEEASKYIQCPIYERTSIKSGAEIAGPAIIEQLDCTTVMHPGDRLTADQWGNLVIEVGR